MKHLLAMVFVVVFSCYLHAQVVDVTVCDILKNPQSYDGKIVRIKGTVAAGFDQFVVQGSDCGQHVDGIWLSYPEGTKAKAGPAAILRLQPARNFSGIVAAIKRQPVSLKKDKDFKQFDSLLSTPHKGGGMCLGCTRYEVSATLEGRLDGTEAGLRRDKTGKIVGMRGFGNLNAYDARLVLQSVTDISRHEIDYSKTSAATGGDFIQESSAGDPVEAAHQAANAFGPNNEAGNQVERAANAFGKPGENNGVEIGFTGVNEASVNLEQKSEHDSPDGVQFNCAFDPRRLSGDAMTAAIVHMGEHIADLRRPHPGSGNIGLYELEYTAWAATTLSAVATGQKTLMVPGGYLLWNASWAPADRNKSLNDALTKFLASQELLTR
jgi:hypothetical protein